MWILFILSPIVNILRYNLIIKQNLILPLMGLSSLMFYLPFFLSILAGTIVISWFRLLVGGFFDSRHKIVMVMASALSVVFLSISGYLINLEENNYPNYLYQHYGLTPDILKFMSFVCLLQLMLFMIISLLGATAAGKTSKKLKTKKKDLGFYVKAPLVISVTGLAIMLIFSIALPINSRFLWDESRMGWEGRFGIHYKYLDALQGNVPESATVIHPPQGDKWPAIGNQPVVRYFLFPRKLVSGALINNNSVAEEIGMAYFVEIDPNSETTKWPIILSETKEVILDEENKIKYRLLEVVSDDKSVKVFRINF